VDRLETKDLAFYRLQSAKERLTVAEDLFKLEHYRDCLSKAYYSLFQAARAALVTLDLDSRKHSGVISMFNIKFVKTGVFPKEYRKIIANSQDLRLASDYDDFYLASKRDAEKTLDDARLVIKGIEDYLNSFYSA
jgi:uncharacterized protein (UPF0332 family)